MCPRHAGSITRFCSGSKQNELRVSTYVENKLSPLPDKAEFIGDCGRMTAIEIPLWRNEIGSPEPSESACKAV